MRKLVTFLPTAGMLTAEGDKYNVRGINVNISPAFPCRAYLRLLNAMVRLESSVVPGSLFS